MDEEAKVASALGAGSADIQSVSRVAQILGLFNNDTPQLAVGPAAAALKLNRTTVHRYFMSMVAAGMLHRSDSGLFGPGPLAIQLGAFALGRRTVIDLAERHLQELAASTRMTAVLSLWGNLGAVVTRVHEGRSGPVVITVPVGTQLSLDTAQSVLYLAFLPDQLAMQRLRAALPPATQRSVGQRIESARRDVVASSAFDDGISSVAAPVFGPDHVIAATLALVHTSSMLSTDLHSEESLKLRMAAEKLSEEMGYRGPGVSAEADREGVGGE